MANYNLEQIQAALNTAGLPLDQAQSVLNQLQGVRDVTTRENLVAPAGTDLLSRVLGNARSTNITRTVPIAQPTAIGPQAPTEQPGQMFAGGAGGGAGAPPPPPPPPGGEDAQLKGFVDAFKLRYPALTADIDAAVAANTLTVDTIRDLLNTYPPLSDKKVRQAIATPQQGQFQSAQAEQGQRAPTAQELQKLSAEWDALPGSVKAQEKSKENWIQKIWREGKEFVRGTPAELLTFENYNQPQRNAIGETLNSAMQGIRGNQYDFEPIAAEARHNFFTKDIPTLAHRFMAQGKNTRRASDTQGAYGAAAANLERGLASLRSQYNLQREPTQHAKLQTGLTPLRQSIFSPATGGLAQAAAAGLGSYLKGAL